MIFNDVVTVHLQSLSLFWLSEIKRKLYKGYIIKLALNGSALPRGIETLQMSFVNAFPPRTAMALTSAASQALKLGTIP